MSGTLFVVATPIGNLGDITLRAVETLRAVDRVLAEDTRRTLTLLNHLGIVAKPLERLDAHAPEGVIERAVERLVSGEKLALVTDAGTPVVSDPGTLLVKRAADRGVHIVPIPGASAVLAAIAGSGLVSGGFRFVGFLPRGGPARREALERVASTEEAAVLFESPERTQATLRDIAGLSPERPATVARELTKVHEEFVRGTVRELSDRGGTWLGEVTIVLGDRPTKSDEPMLTDAEMERRIDEGFEKKRRARDIAEEVALWSGLSKKEVYTKVLERKRVRGGAD
ncbi:MAG: 16S rRNA (cytidine(1402)-2'-O)-methyltransferase [Polyangiaceae bacterium]|nr:16S rRNA (cytidine(1402)-2'-O)-methyltransferase [Polyangiaceae bacterium]